MRYPTTRSDDWTTAYIVVAWTNYWRTYHGDGDVAQWRKALMSPLVGR